MLELYHTDMAVCAAKVRITLAEKHLAWTGHHVDLASGEQFTAAYLRLNANAVVPTLVHDGIVIRDSTVINEYLEDAFPDIPLRPASARDRAGMRYWTKQEDDIHQVVNTFMTAIAFRAVERQKSKRARQERIAAITDRVRRERWESLTDAGLDSPFAAVAFNRLARLLKDMDAALRETAWLGTQQFSLADIGYLPYLNALSMLQLAPLWNERFTAVASWLEKARARPGFIEGVERWLPAGRIEGLSRAGLQETELAQRRFEQSLVG